MSVLPDVWRSGGCDRRTESLTEGAGTGVVVGAGVGQIRGSKRSFLWEKKRNSLTHSYIDVLNKSPFILHLSTKP